MRDFHDNNAVTPFLQALVGVDLIAGLEYCGDLPLLRALDVLPVGLEGQLQLEQAGVGLHHVGQRAEDLEINKYQLKITINKECKVPKTWKINTQ